MRPPKVAPWESFNFRTQPRQYMSAVLAYTLEGNTGVNWDVHLNPVRKWYHAPWMHRGGNPREFVRGLTRERSSRPGELHPQQTGFVQNWAVGIYNPRAGYTIGSVWMTPSGVPDPSKARFNSGAVAAKLLFTRATVAQAPFLTGAYTWQANTEDDPSNLQTLRLVQIDIAVRDTRNSSRTGWLFGTFIYDGNAPGTTPWEKFVPVGLTWGNDPSVTPGMVASGTALTQTWINDAARPLMQHYGWAGRLNGPVDNPVSSCLSCHSTSQIPRATAMTPAAGLTDQQKLRWFRNIRAGQPFDVGSQSLDYSLQLTVGIQNYEAASPANSDGP